MLFNVILYNFLELSVTDKSYTFDYYRHALISITFYILLFDYRMTLYEFADVLLDYGFVQAINLDGGGSTTLIINGTLVNHPTDKW